MNVLFPNDFSILGVFPYGEESRMSIFIEHHLRVLEVESPLVVWGVANGQKLSQVL